jgi:hypothetical protein
VEFARDVETQTDESPFTQENVARYLARLNVSAVFFNAGLHDLAFAKNESQRSELFDCCEENLAWYAHLLHGAVGPGKLHWIPTTAVKREAQPVRWRNITTNEGIHHMNVLANRVMRELNISVVQGVHAMSETKFFQDLNQDGVHYNGRDFLFLPLSGIRLALSASFLRRDRRPAASA